MMNNTFSLNRASRIAVKLLRENWREYVMMLSIMAVTLIIVFLWLGISQSESICEADPAPNDEVGTGLVFIFLFGTISASMVFSGMSTPASRLSTIMTPASQLEKYLVRWVIFVPAFLIVYVLFFLLADVVRFAVVSAIFTPEHYSPETVGLSTIYYDLDDKTNFILAWIMMLYMVMTSLFTLGAIIWQKKSYLKTAFAIVVIGMVYGFIGCQASRLAPSFDPSAPFIYSSDEKGLSYFICFVGMAIAAVNYVIAYFRFKENEIVDRW